MYDLEMSFKHHTAVAVGPVKLLKSNNRHLTHSHMHSRARTHTRTNPGMQKADETSQPLAAAASWETATQSRTSVWTPQHPGYSGGWEGRGGEKKGERIEEASAVQLLRKPVFLSPLLYLWLNKELYTHEYLLPPTVFSIGIFILKAAMHNKGSVLCLLVGWSANTPQLIMCLSVAVWAAAKGIRSSIGECRFPRSRGARHASKIFSPLKRDGWKKK